MQNFYVYEYVNGFGLVQGILLSLVIFFYPGGNANSNKYLGFHLFFISLALAAPFSQRLFYTLTPRADRFIEPFLLLIYPCLYLYIKSFSTKIKLSDIGLHGLPFFVYTPLVVLSLAYQEALARWTFSTFDFNVVLLLFVVIKSLLFWLYLHLCWQETNRLQRLIKNNFSEISRINLIWAKQLILAGIGLLAAYFLVMLLIVGSPGLAKLNFLLVSLLTVYIYFATYKGLSQPAVFKQGTNPPRFQEKESPAAADGPAGLGTVHSDRAKYERSALPDARLEELMRRLKDLMEYDRLFLEPELTIQKLGEKLDVSPYYISQVLSQKLKNNFYDFVNSYRVEEAKKLLLNPAFDNFTLLAIAFESGFNSKTTFNTVFKKFTTQTPSQFKMAQTASL